MSHEDAPTDSDALAVARWYDPDEPRDALAGLITSDHDTVAGIEAAMVSRGLAEGYGRALCGEVFGLAGSHPDNVEEPDGFSDYTRIRTAPLPAIVRALAVVARRHQSWTPTPSDKAREIANDTSISSPYRREIEHVLAGMRWAAEECARIALHEAPIFEPAPEGYPPVEAMAYRIARKIRARFLRAAEEKPVQIPGPDPFDDPQAPPSERAALVERAEILLKGLLVRTAHYYQDEPTMTREVVYWPTVEAISDFALAEAAELRSRYQEQCELTQEMRANVDVYRSERDAARAWIQSAEELIASLRTEVEEARALLRELERFCAINGLSAGREARAYLSRHVAQEQP